MPADEQIILRPGMKPIRAKKVRWYQEPAFLERRRDPPKIPQLAVEILLDDGSVDLARRGGGPGDRLSGRPPLLPQQRLMALWQNPRPAPCLWPQPRNKLRGDY